MASFAVRRRFARRVAAVCSGLWFLLAGGTLPAAAPANGGAGHTHQIRNWIDEAGRNPAVAASEVTVIVETDPGVAVSSLVSAHGGKLRYRRGRLHEVSIPGGKLSSLIGALPSGAWIRLPYPHQEASVTSQGVAITGAADMQALGQSGAGMTIGVIDLYFASYTSAQASGDLPASLVFTDYTGTGAGPGTHGTSVAEIVYDMAPGASLRLARINTDLQLSQAVDDMIAAGVDVIVHSIVWFGGSFYDGTGPFCADADSANQAGIQWVNAVGNHRNKHYLDTFTDSDSDLRHEFSSGQNFNTIALTAGTQSSLILNWDAYPKSKVDYDLYLYNGNPDAGGTVVASSTNKPGAGPNGGIEPIEIITYTPSVTGTYYIVVRKASSSTSNLRLTLFSNGPDLGVKTAASSILQPSNCVNVIGVGAVSLSDSIDWNSSAGPTTDGRAKPEVTGPTGVQTSRTSSFGGTSAATPHVGGAVALLRAQNPGLTLDQIKWLLTTTAKDVYTTGYDYSTGYGRISLDADGDGFNHDTDNCPLASNANQQDTDGDGVGDACDPDIDGDGLTNAQETVLGTNPLIPDTDGDGLTDGAEVNTYGTNPLLADTDGDGLTDGAEVNTYGTSPTVSNKGDLTPSTAPDGQINVSDLMMLMRFVEQLQVPTARDLILGDMNGDSVLDIRDVLLLRRQLGY